MVNAIESKYEACSTNLESLVEYASTHPLDRNEATTRTHLIDTLLFDCLGWQKHEVLQEEHQRTEHNEYTDYTFYAPRRAMILEAKRESAYFEVPAGHTGQKYLIKSLCKPNAPLKSAVEQVAGYCQSRGVPIGAVCNGHQFVAFLATRNDGVAPLEGYAIVFPSLAFMATHFLDFWNCFSPFGIEEKGLLSRLLGALKPEVAPKLSSSLGASYPGIKNRNLFQTDLKVITDIVFEDIVGSPDLEEEFLRQCYCRSGVLSRHSLASKAIIASRYSAIFDSTSPGPTTVPAITTKGISNDLIAKSMSRRPVLLIGDVGVGKTLFIKHLIRVDAWALLSEAITVYLDLGSEATLSID